MVFLIGMRINRWRKVRAWWPVFVGMPTMLRELAGRPEAGLLGAKSYWAGPRPDHRAVLAQSTEHLGRFARDPEMQHQPAWAAFNKARRPAATSASGTRPTSSRPPTSRASTATCPSTASVRRSARSRRGQHRRNSAQDEMGQRDPEYVAP